MKLLSLTPEEWAFISENAHLVVFDKHKPVALERIDFVLAMEDPVKGPMGYVTCRELDGKSLYWQFGGVFPGTRDSLWAYRVCQAFVRWSKERYDRLSFYVENTNAPMLKMAAKVGFKIVGIRTYKNSILLEHLLDFTEEK